MSTGKHRRSTTAAGIRGRAGIDDRSHHYLKKGDLCKIRRHVDRFLVDRGLRPDVSNASVTP